MILGTICLLWFVLNASISEISMAKNRNRAQCVYPEILEKSHSWPNIEYRFQTLARSGKRRKVFELKLLH